VIAAPHPAARTRLLCIDPARGTFSDGEIGDLPALLGAGDLLVVNDAATLPASLAGRDAAGRPVELRLYAERPDGTFAAVAFGAGDWRTPTEHRPPPPPLAPGARLTVGGLDARIERVLDRRVELRFELDGDALWSALYRAGRPVQYAHLEAPLPLWAVQTRYAARPWAAELPSAGRPLTWALLFALKRRGVAIAAVTHACGLSATGDAALDAALPLPERYDVPAETVDAVARASRVIAVGTSVVRALEGCARAHGRLVAGEGETDLIVDGAFRPRVVAGLLTGLHERTASHFALLQAFAPLPLLERAYAHAAVAAYRGHEFGDACLITSAQG
jgi:S-adenosylmethionine:tRNA ribosyltransferase-isomerase